MTSIEYHAGPPREKTPFIASALRAIAWVILPLALLGIPFTYTRDLMSLRAAVGVAIGSLFFSLVCFGLAKIIVLLSKIEANTKTEETLNQEVKLLREISKHTEAKVDETPRSHP
jgi:hypothetical protein